VDGNDMSGETGCAGAGVTIRAMQRSDLPGLASSAAAAIAGMHHRLGLPTLDDRPTNAPPSPMLRHLLELDAGGAAGLSAPAPFGLWTVRAPDGRLNASTFRVAGN